MSLETTILNEYLKLTNKYKKEYGEQTVVLMQVGSFFEIYGLLDKDTKEISTITSIKEVCQICNLNIAEKKVCVGKDQVLMAGYRDYSLEKYLPKMTENGYTVVVYVQEKMGKEVTRKLYAIYSPGTYISYDVDSSPQITNNIMCIWFELVKPIKSQNIDYNKKLIYGISVANIFTGETFVFEYECPYSMNPTTFDELERCFSVFLPSEVIIISPFNDKQLNNIIQYCNVKTSNIHKCKVDDFSNEKIQNCSKQIFIDHILTQFFNSETFNICKEFQSYTIATQSFCYLLNFIQEHNKDLVRKISLPKFNNMSNRVILANHTLKQLNIIDDNIGREFGNLSSVGSFLNKCNTSMGKRLFNYQITNPTFDTEWLNNEYKMISLILEDMKLVEKTRKKLAGMRDIEKICRQLILRKLYPSSLYYFYKSVETIRELNHSFSINPQFSMYFCNSCDEHSSKNVEYICNEILNFLQSQLNIDVCRNLYSMTAFENNLICPGVSIELDKIIEKQNTNTLLLHKIHQYLNKLMSQTSGKESDETEYVKIHETEKMGKSLQITKKRATILKTQIANILKSNPIVNLLNDESNINKEFFIDLNEIKFSSATTTTDEIHFPLLNKITKELCSLSEQINSTIGRVYQEILTEFENKWFSEMDKLNKYVAKIDVLQSKAYIAKNYNYCCPIINLQSNSKSYINVNEIRHALIEHINKNELYVTNDVELNKTNSGILLYGINAVGKTSLIRAVGICVIMAQSGMFVPCSKFEYYPYKAIYSRILSNDNLFKGLSTFAVEMSELRVILNNADENSLVLGDELASGTENESALSIFAAALIDLNNKKTNFMFATHFHEISKFEEIKKLENNGLSYKHLSVFYDRELDCLVYDRKLKDGQGSRIYGLEVCNSLHLPLQFMETAFKIRNRYFPENKGELSQQITKYNSQKIKGICEICKSEIATEIHHLAQQKYASENGFIGSFHKNHVANLTAVCEKCHLNFHHPNVEPFNEKHEDVKKKKIRKKTTKGYVII